MWTTFKVSIGDIQIRTICVYVNQILEGIFSSMCWTYSKSVLAKDVKATHKF